LTPGPEIDLDDSLCLQIFWVKRNFAFLPFSFGFDEKRIVKVIVMKVKRRFVVPLSVSLYDLSVGNPCILDEHINIRTAFSISSADIPFDRKPMVSFMRRRHHGREPNYYHYGQDPFPPL